MNYKDERLEVDNRLQKAGISNSIGELYENPSLNPGIEEKLLELLEHACSAQMYSVLAHALFLRKPNLEQKRKAVQIMLERIKRFDVSNPGEETFLSLLIVNEFARNVGANKLHEVGQMTLDKRYGSLRSDLTYVLYKIGGADAVLYLKKAAKDPVTASSALYCLFRSGKKEVLELCEEALKIPDVLFRDVIEETHRTIKRRLDKEMVMPSHATHDSIPPDLGEWSSNLDGSEMPKTLKCIQKCLEAGFGKAESSEVQESADEMSVDQEVRFKFNVKFTGHDTILWLEVFCDDEDAYDLYIFGIPELVNRIEHAIEKVFK